MLIGLTVDSACDMPRADHGAIRDRLEPNMNPSCAGDSNKLCGLPDYDQLARTCEEHGAQPGATGLSIAGMVNVGEGALTLGFAEHRTNRGSEFLSTGARLRALTLSTPQE